MLATCHFDFNSIFRMISLFTFILHYITNWFLHKYRFDANANTKPAFSCVLDSLWLAVEVWEQHRGQRPCFVLFLLWSGPVWSVGAILRKVAITMMHWLTSELLRRLGNFHNAFKSASWYLKTRLYNDTMSRPRHCASYAADITERLQRLRHWQARRMFQSSVFYCCSVWFGLYSYLI